MNWIYLSHSPYSTADSTTEHKYFKKLLKLDDSDLCLVLKQMRPPDQVSFSLISKTTKEKMNKVYLESPEIKPKIKIAISRIEISILIKFKKFKKSYWYYILKPVSENGKVLGVSKTFADLKFETSPIIEIEHNEKTGGFEYFHTIKWSVADSFQETLKFFDHLRFIYAEPIKKLEMSFDLNTERNIDIVLVHLNMRNIERYYFEQIESNDNLLRKVLDQLATDKLILQCVSTPTFAYPVQNLMVKDKISISHGHYITVEQIVHMQAKSVVLTDTRLTHFKFKMLVESLKAGHYIPKWTAVSIECDEVLDFNDIIGRSFIEIQEANNGRLIDRSNPPKTYKFKLVYRNKDRTIKQLGSHYACIDGRLLTILIGGNTGIIIIQPENETTLRVWL